MWTYGPVTIQGHLASKANGRRKTHRGFIKSQIALDFVETFAIQIGLLYNKNRWIAFEKPVALFAWVYYQDMRRDLDISLLQDCIQAARIIKNDRQIQEIHAKRFIDKAQPRVVFELRELAD